MRIYVYKHLDDPRLWYSPVDKRAGRCNYGWWRDAKLLYAIRYHRKPL